MKLVQVFLKSGETVYFHADRYAENDKSIEFYNGEELAGTFRKYAVRFAYIPLRGLVLPPPCADWQRRVLRNS